METPLYRELAALVAARINCIASKNDEWLAKHESRIKWLVSERLPSGSGFDSDTDMDLKASWPNRLVFQSAYHKMNAGGFYDGWIHFAVTVKPSLGHGCEVSGKGNFGRSADGHKDYILEEFQSHLDICADWQEQYRKGGL